MSYTSLLSKVFEPIGLRGRTTRDLSALIDAIPDGSRASSTPCSSYHMGDLLDHIAGITVAWRNSSRMNHPDLVSQSGQSGPGLGHAASDQLRGS